MTADTAVNTINFTTAGISLEANRTHLPKNLQQVS